MNTIDFLSPNEPRGYVEFSNILEGGGLQTYISDSEREYTFVSRHSRFVQRYRIAKKPGFYTFKVKVVDLNKGSFTHLYCSGESEATVYSVEVVEGKTTVVELSLEKIRSQNLPSPLMLYRLSLDVKKPK